MPVLEFRINGNPNELLKFEVKKIVKRVIPGETRKKYKSTSMS